MTFSKLTIGTTEKRIVKVEPTRTSLTVFNNSANILYIGKRLQNTTGYPIPAGGNISFKIPEDDPTQELYGTASGAGSDIRIYEGYGKK